MIKRTLYFEKASYLSVHLDQLKVTYPKNENIASIPIEDIGVVILDNPQITITHGLIRKLQSNKCAIITCDEKHMPQGLLLPFEGNHLQAKVQKHQLASSLSLKKNLWQQTVEAKVTNQMKVLKSLGKNYKKLQVLAKRVSSGDQSNIEGQAAAFYWSELFDEFKRDRFGEEPNNALNYGYSILRSMIARALVSSGLLPTLGIFHQSQYNAFALADDIMEPFRPFIDIIVYKINLKEDNIFDLTREIKQELLSVATIDAHFNRKSYPLMVGMSLTTKSLADCFEGTRRKIIFPIFP